MGKLLDPERVRKARRARKERAAKILETAHQAFLRHPYAEVTLDLVGRLAGVKQGQANLAFRSREELYLAVVREQLSQWHDALETTLSSSDETLSREDVADIVASSLAERRELTRLLGPLHQALELHDDGIEVHTFYHRLRQRLLELGELIAKRLGSAHPWECFDALYRAQMISAAVDPVSNPVGNLAVDLVVEEHQVFALDLEDEIRRVVLHSLGG